MFDYRYHALSLAAVLIALALGVLLGVAIGDANLVSSAKNGIVANLRRDLGGRQAQIDQLRGQLAAHQTFENDLYPIAVNGQLIGKNIGVVFLGASSDQIDGLVRTALTSTGGQLTMVGAVREPVDLAGLGNDAVGTRYTGVATTPQLVHQLGVRLGIQLVHGGPLIKRARDRLLSSFNGQLGRLDAVVVVHDEPPGLVAPETQIVSDLETGLIAGITAVHVPAVGVELTNTNPSQISWYKSRGMASVDDLDGMAGQTALVYSLAGAHGSYGVKSTADSLLPRIAGPLPTP